MEKRLPTRKNIRMQGFDYASCGIYFITICTKDRKCILWESVGAICDRPPEQLKLSEAGETVEAELAVVGTIYPSIRLELCCIMPNHVHLLLVVEPDESGRSQIAPTPVFR